MDQNDKEIGASSTPADSGDLPSAEVQPAPTDVPPLHVTDSGTGTYGNNSGSNTKYEVEANREEKLMVKETKGSSRINVEDKKNPEDVLKEMQMQKTHDLYCPNCTHNITRTAKLCEKGREKSPYIKDKFILSFVIVISFKHPFIYLPWFYNTTPGKTSDEPDTSGVNETPKKHVPDWLRFILVVVLLLLSALVLLWAPPTPSPPLSPSPLPTPTPRTNGSLTADIPDPQKVPEDVIEENDGNLIPQGSGVVEEDKPIWPSPPPPIENKGSWINFYWVKGFATNRVLSVISLLLLVVLALCWPSTSPTKRTKGETVEIKAYFPNWWWSVPGNKTYGSETETEIRPPVFSLRTRLGKLPGILKQHIVVPVQNVLQTELDILKSIVYGGLIESITSFGVVSSAAASGTSTSNQRSGLGTSQFVQWAISHHFTTQVVLGYKFWQLYGLVTSDRFFPYEHFLGNKDNVKLHCIVVVVSFIFFGVIPPLFYGLSFKITDNGHYEATVFVAASLLCVITLSFGKAHAFKKEKLKTVAVYTGIAIGASAFSFVASQHVRDLLEKYEFHMIASEFAKK
ncbi:hypothetical protein Bca52824_012543 [Brassica carinata]|uniref:Uncharacterized protein n=1 Tax=Brassica carinata TaxID=52824 RepID=A0A8X8B1M8_BRACI|nr:hypothetical protein Bca52824_012543 [Brassica carinata]